MDDLTYTLEWRGIRKSGYRFEDIEAALVTGDLHSMYKIHANGRWQVLRDYLEQYRAQYAAAALSAFDYQNQSPPDQPSSHEPLPSYDEAMSEPAQPQRLARHRERSTQLKPAWFWPAIILSGTACLMLALVLVYVLASQHFSPQRIDTSSEKTAMQEARKNENPNTDNQPIKASEPAHKEQILSNEDVATLKSPHVIRINAIWKEPDSKKGGLIQAGSTGSAVHIKNEGGYAYFVTNKHVVVIPKGAKDVHYFLEFNGEEIPFEVVKKGRYELDLAMVRCKDGSNAKMEPLKSARLAELKAGQECVAIGNALGEGISVTSGVISAFDDWSEGKYVRTSAPISSGNSGGGLFRTKDGALIGITTLASGQMKNGVVQNMNRAIPMDYVLSDIFWEDL
ncbi:S1C family serine protease [Prosthecobacter vanneervenii]|uniref:S1-C subfamily serine protease n=1 Tax=Prosthecobacter vanneervenii TaxID=48466 RepID=A0A7W8DL04_9BACT|nr:S1C family serine protease [Prosthecobacter vanneervenii]MBB5033560.1 S1-C subfamily serine protease [Prosthecobacter vanneervenii]